MEYDQERKSTLTSIPARARAVYAPREKPKMHILSPYWSIQASMVGSPQIREATITYSSASEIRTRLVDDVGLI